jgi:hypothetical protein
MQCNIALESSIAVEEEPLDKQRSLIDVLETSISRRSLGSRADVLRRVTDLCLVGSEGRNAKETAVFDDVLSRLAKSVDTATRAELGRQIATIPKRSPKYKPSRGRPRD